jgi:hypothetical protein
LTWRIIARPGMINKMYSVPDLQFDAFVYNCDHFCTKLNSNGDFVFLPESMIDELQQKARFTHS